MNTERSFEELYRHLRILSATYERDINGFSKIHQLKAHAQARGHHAQIQCLQILCDGVCEGILRPTSEGGSKSKTTSYNAEQWLIVQSEVERRLSPFRLPRQWFSECLQELTQLRSLVSESPIEWDTIATNDRLSLFVRDEERRSQHLQAINRSRQFLDFLYSDIHGRCLNARPAVHGQTAERTSEHQISHLDDLFYCLEETLSGHCSHKHVADLEVDMSADANTRVEFGLHDAPGRRFPATIFKSTLPLVSLGNDSKDQLVKWNLSFSTDSRTSWILWFWQLMCLLWIRVKQRRSVPRYDHPVEDLCAFLSKVSRSSKTTKDLSHDECIVRSGKSQHLVQVCLCSKEPCFSLFRTRRTFGAILRDIYDLRVRIGLAFLMATGHSTLHPSAWLDSGTWNSQTIAFSGHETGNNKSFLYVRAKFFQNQPTSRQDASSHGVNDVVTVNLGYRLLEVFMIGNPRSNYALHQPISSLDQAVEALGRFRQSKDALMTDVCVMVEWCIWRSLQTDERVSGQIFEREVLEPLQVMRNLPLREHAVYKRCRFEHMAAKLKAIVEKSLRPISTFKDAVTSPREDLFCPMPFIADFCESHGSDLRQMCQAFVDLTPFTGDFEASAGNSLDFDQFRERVRSRSGEGVLLTLLLIYDRPPSQTWLKAWERLLKTCMTPTSEAHNLCLPLKSHIVEKLFGENVVQRDSFERWQYCFCAIQLSPSSGDRLIQPKREQLRSTLERLPLLDKQKIGSSSAFGKVYKVTVSRGHFHNHEHVELAMKELRINDQVQDEYATMSCIIDQPLRHDHIMMARACVRYGPENDQRLLVFTDLATADLYHYMTNYNARGPSNSLERLAMFGCIIQVASALQYLHHGLQSPSHAEIACFHQDIKAENILVFHGASGLMLKITDFGISTIKLTEMGEETTWNRKTAYFKPYPSTRTSRRGQTRRSGDMRPNGPPEGIEATDLVDVWGFGTVFAEYLAWLFHGLADFEISRRGKHGNDGSHEITAEGPTLRGGIPAWFVTKIAQEYEARQDDPNRDADMTLLERSRDVLIGSALVCNAKERASMEHVKSSLDNIYTYVDGQLKRSKD